MYPEKLKLQILWFQIFQVFIADFAMNFVWIKF